MYVNPQTAGQVPSHFRHVHPLTDCIVSLAPPSCVKHKVQPYLQVILKVKAWTFFSRSICSLLGFASYPGGGNGKHRDIVWRKAIEQALQILSLAPYPAAATLQSWICAIPRLKLPHRLVPQTNQLPIMLLLAAIEQLLPKTTKNLLRRARPDHSKLWSASKIRLIYSLTGAKSKW